MLGQGNIGGWAAANWLCGNSKIENGKEKIEKNNAEFAECAKYEEKSGEKKACGVRL